MAKINHYGLTKLARIKARDNYGSKHANEDAAIKSMSSEQMIEGALLELVLRLNQAIRAWATTDDDDPDQKPNRDEERPDYATPFPDAKVGDIYYSAGDDLEDGLNRLVVVTVDAEHYIRLASTTPYFYDGKIFLSWGSEGDEFPTAAEAAKAAAESEKAWHEPRYRQAVAVLAAIEAGLPFEHLLGEPAGAVTEESQ